MKQFIVITSIQQPTEGIRSFAALKDYKLVVVGDKKTNTNWVCHNVEFLSVARQKEISDHLSRALPYNHYSRKMLGYLYAIMQGADTIIDTDDDNIPKQNWGFPALEGSFPSVRGEKGFINIYQWYTDKNIWPRGLPLHLVKQQFDLEKDIVQMQCRIGVWQLLVDQNPDVDAIYRLTNDAPCIFSNKGPVVLNKSTVSPFNSQNTLTRKELFPLLYLPAHVSFRFTDILRSLVAQPIMWHYGYQLGFSDATVIQKRNPHNYFNDFILEVPMYQHSNSIIEIVDKSIAKNNTITDNLFNAYSALNKNKIVPSKEMKALNAWLKELQQHLS